VEGGTGTEGLSTVAEGAWVKDITLHPRAVASVQWVLGQDVDGYDHDLLSVCCNEWQRLSTPEVLESEMRDTR
jgi:hypothetical protein